MMKFNPSFLILVAIILFAVFFACVGCQTSTSYDRVSVSSGVTNSVSFSHERPWLSKASISEVDISSSTNDIPRVKLSGYQNDQEQSALLINSMVQALLQASRSVP